MTEASGAEGLAWCRPVSKSPDRPLGRRDETMKTCSLIKNANIYDHYADIIIYIIKLI